MNTKTLISVVGPTAIGKTSLAIQLANHFSTEIISADSRQFYKDMCIGTAVPSAEELRAAKHHFIQNLSIIDAYSVGDFERDVIERITQLFKIHDVLILVGGSGLYVDAVTKGLDSFPKVDDTIRQDLNLIFQEHGLKHLQEQLKTLDPIYYERVDIENPHRLIRALEICIGSGKPYSSFLNNPKQKRDFKTISIGLEAERPIIYDRINKRVDMMMAQGLLDEVKSLQPYKHLNSLNTVGYKELFKHLDGEWDLDFSVAEIKKNTRRFSKRQLTWFKKNEATLWFDYKSDSNTILESINKKM